MRRLKNITFKNIISIFMAATIMSQSAAGYATQTTSTYSSLAYPINSYGILDSTNPSGDRVVIDADDIRNNALAIYQIKRQLLGLDGKVIKWSDEMGTYVIATYETDENGDIVYDENGNPKIASEEPIGALGTSDPTMVVENGSFSSLYAKGDYDGTDSQKQPGSDQNGTLVDVLNNGWGPDQIAGNPSYADNDTIGTGTGRREKGEPATGPNSKLPAEQRTHDLDVNRVEYTDPGSVKEGVSSSAPTLSDGTVLVINKGQYSSSENDKVRLTADDTYVTLGVNEQVTLPAGYYSKEIVLSNGVVNQTNTGAISVTNAVAAIDPSADNKTAAAGNKHSAIANGTHAISDFNSSTAIALGAEGEVTLPAGYYSQAILIQNASKDILSGKYSTYTPGRSYLPSSATSGTNSVHPAITKLGDETYVLGINEQVTLPAGYYSKPITLANGVVNNSQTSKITITDTVPTADENPTDKTALAGNKYVTVPNGEYNVNDFDVSTKSLALGAEAKVILPSGFYSKDILIQNTSKDILSGKYATYTPIGTYMATVNDKGTNSVHPAINKLGKTEESDNTYILGINEQVTFPAGYYSKQVVVANGDVHRTQVSKITIADTVRATDEEEEDNTPDAGNRHETVANGTYDIGDFNTTTMSLALGAEAKVTLPAGFYSKDILVQNTSKDIMSENYSPYVAAFYKPATSSTGNNSVHPTFTELKDDDTYYVLGISEKVTLPAGYYSDQITFANGVYDQARYGSITVEDTVIKKDPGLDNKNATAGNKYLTLDNGTHALASFNSSTRPISLGAEGHTVIPAGYYSNDILIESTAKDILSGNYAPYVANNNYVADRTTTTAATKGSNSHHSTYAGFQDLEAYVLDANDQITLPAGYYTHQMTFQNGVINQTRNGGTFTVAGTQGTTDTADGNNTASAGNKKLTVTNATHNVNTFNTSTTPLALGAEATVTIPAGYYSQAILVKNNSKDILSGAYGSYDDSVHNYVPAGTAVNGSVSTHPAINALNTTTPFILGINEKVVMPAGFYKNQIVFANGVLNNTTSTKITIGGTVDGKDPNSNNKSAAYGEKSNTVTNAAHNISEFGTTYATALALGSEGSVTIPSGYYSNSILIQNASKNILSGSYASYSTTNNYVASKDTNAGSAANGTYHATPSISELKTKPYVLTPNETITLPAGYYSHQVTIKNGVINQTRDGGTFTVAGTQGTTDGNANNKTAANGNKNNTIGNGTYNVSTFTTSKALALAPEASVTIPAGYYSVPFVVQNSAKDIVSGNYGGVSTGSVAYTSRTTGKPNSIASMSTAEAGTYHLGVNEKVTLPAGYYRNQITFANAEVDILARNISATTATYNDGANYTVKSTSGWSGSSRALSSSTTTIYVGVSEQVTLPAGYYSNAMTILNGVKNNGAYTKTGLKPNQTVTGGAGYYSSISVSVSPASGTVNYADLPAAYHHGATYDMGVDNLVRYVNAAKVCETGQNDVKTDIGNGGSTYVTPTKYDYITANGNSGKQTYGLDKARYINQVVVDQTAPYNAGYNAGVTKGRSDVVAEVDRGGTGYGLTTKTYSKLKTSGENTTSKTYDIGLGYYNHIVVDQSATYQAGYDAGKNDAGSATSTVSVRLPATTDWWPNQQDSSGAEYCTSTCPICGAQMTAGGYSKEMAWYMASAALLHHYEQVSHDFSG